MIASLSKLGLGTGQFGLDQPPGGRGRPREAEARDMLSIAGRSGLSVLDVAGRSATADTLLRGALPQPNPFRMTLTTIRPDRGPELVETELRAQMLRLGVERIDTLLAPSATDLFSPLGPQLWDRMKALKDAGVCKKIGVSVYASDDPIGVARRFKPDLVQAPASLLDQRMLLDGTLSTIAELGIEVHLRSIFLNGILFLPPDRAPSHLKAAAGRISRARRLIAEGKSDPLQAALGFALTRPEAAAVLVGVTSAAEMTAVVAAAMSPPPDLDWDEMALDDPDALAWAAA
ncbi:bifunctional regulator KidO [Phenylobacterium sp.]|uniref:bifunctional regulator KidO n=1 Tax=Phenylobacterium sp. TaxID=1871053 RepID=UPI0025D4EAA9|nr:bifunctional regulator KidO [Phenylobacterium sp.]